jgi:colicin import membrane protein
MKKTYVYFIAPLVFTAIFAVFYVSYAKDYNARLAKMEENKQLERKKKLDEEAKAREKAIADAVAQTEKRKKEKAEKEAREQQERDRRELAAQELRKAQEDSRKYEDQLKRLQKDIDENKDAIAKINEDKKQLVEQEKFLRDYVQKAEANTQSLTGVMEKIDAADKARAAAAALEAKKRSS